MTGGSLRRLQERAVPQARTAITDPPHRTRRRSRNPRTACQSASPTQRRMTGVAHDCRSARCRSTHSLTGPAAPHATKESEPANSLSKRQSNTAAL